MQAGIVEQAGRQAGGRAEKQAGSKRQQGIHQSMQADRDGSVFSFSW
jgi:hypothetical protein